MALPTSSQEDAAVGILYDAVTERHVRPDHVEHPIRTITLNEHLKTTGIMSRCQHLPSRQATDEELYRAHPQEYIAKVEGLYSPDTLAADGEPAVAEGDCLIISGDIFCTEHTAVAARTAAGCCIEAVEKVLDGTVQRAFAVVRPPGHHAESSAYMGFCFYNNASVAAHAALARGVKRVLILDWDIHHGNGTQEIFWSDPRVLFASLHRRDKDFYPRGVGYAEEVGGKPGQGFNVNVPWNSKGMGDADYLAAFELILEPIIVDFDPELIIISAGFDAVEGDPLGGCRVTPAGFAAMTQRLMKFAKGKVVAVLEGGYQPSLVANCTAAVVAVMLGEAPPPLEGPAATKLAHNLSAVLTKVHNVHCEYWPSLNKLGPIKHRLQAYEATLALAGMSLRPIRGSPRIAARAEAAAAATAAAAGAGNGSVEQHVPPVSLAEAAARRKAAVGTKPRIPIAARKGKTAAAAAAAVGAHAAVQAPAAVQARAGAAAVVGALVATQAPAGAAAVGAPLAVQAPAGAAAVGAPVAVQAPAGPAAVGAPVAVQAPAGAAAVGAPLAVQAPAGAAAVGAPLAVQAPAGAAAVGAPLAVQAPTGAAAVGAPVAVQAPAGAAAVVGAQAASGGLAAADGAAGGARTAVDDWGVGVGGAGKEAPSQLLPAGGSKGASADAEWKGAPLTPAAAAVPASSAAPAVVQVDATGVRVGDSTAVVMAPAAVAVSASPAQHTTQRNDAQQADGAGGFQSTSQQLSSVQQMDHHEQQQQDQSPLAQQQQQQGWEQTGPALLREILSRMLIVTATDPEGGTASHGYGDVSSPVSRALTASAAAAACNQGPQVCYPTTSSAAAPAATGGASISGGAVPHSHMCYPTTVCSSSSKHCEAVPQEEGVSRVRSGDDGIISGTEWVNVRRGSGSFSSSSSSGGGGGGREGSEGRGGGESTSGRQEAAAMDGCSTYTRSQAAHEGYSSRSEWNAALGGRMGPRSETSSTWAVLDDDSEVMSLVSMCATEMLLEEPPPQQQQQQWMGDCGHGEPTGEADRGRGAVGVAGGGVEARENVESGTVHWELADAAEKVAAAAASGGSHLMEHLTSSADADMGGHKAHSGEAAGLQCSKESGGGADEGAAVFDMGTLREALLAAALVPLPDSE